MKKYNIVFFNAMNTVTDALGFVPLHSFPNFIFQIVYIVIYQCLLLPSSRLFVFALDTNNIILFDRSPDNVVWQPLQLHATIRQWCNL